MGRKLYVGNLSYDVDSSALQTLFAAHGTVDSAEVIADRDTGRSKGFGFVEMSSDQEAQQAIQDSFDAPDPDSTDTEEFPTYTDEGYSRQHTGTGR